MANVPNAQQATEKWVRRTQASTLDMQRGVEAVTENPAEKAVKQKEKFRQRLIDSIDSGKWERGMRRVTTEGWREAMLKKGVPRVAQGVQEAAPKMEAFMGEFLPFLAGVKREVDAMPSISLNDNINRMVKQIQLTAAFKRGQR